MLARAAAMLSAARRPVIVVGPSVARDGPGRKSSLSPSGTRPRVGESLSSRNSFPEQHPLFAGFLPRTARSWSPASRGAI